MPCIPLHQTWQIHPCQLSIDALKTITPNVADHHTGEIHNLVSMGNLVSGIEKYGDSTMSLSLLADLPPLVEHRCLKYHYTKPGRSTPPVNRA